MKQYIDKDALVAEIKRLIKHSEMVADHNTQITELVSRELDALYHLISFLDTLEVKGVDLDGEINLWVRNLHRVPNFEELKKFARHFFELGLKAQKGENAKEERYVVGVTGKYTTTTK